MKTPAAFRIRAVIVLLLVACSSYAADLTIIDLHHRTAEEVLSALRPLVDSEVALSGIDYKLLVRGSASEVARIREALTVLDRAPRQWMISVRYSAGPESRTSDIGVASGTTNRSSQITLGGGVTTSTIRDNSVSTVRVLEGNGAHIATGQSVPVVTAVILPSPSNTRSVIAGVATDYRELTSGFNVVPRVNGDRVILDISTQQQRATDLGSGSATVQRTTTTVAGRLNEWIDLGGVTSSLSEQRTDIGIGGGTRRLTTQSDERTVAVKVEQVD